MKLHEANSKQQLHHLTGPAGETETSASALYHPPATTNPLWSSACHHADDDKNNDPMSLVDDIIDILDEVQNVLDWKDGEGIARLHHMVTISSSHLYPPSSIQNGRSNVTDIEDEQRQRSQSERQ